ncbi:MAG TPA: hypothetical protein VIJ94_06030 [Caulobacteraceae bacterium]
MLGSVALEDWRDRVALAFATRYDRTGRHALLSRSTYDQLADAGVDLSCAKMLEHCAPHVPGVRP